LFYNFTIIDYKLGYIEQVVALKPRKIIFEAWVPSGFALRLLCGGR